jgi:hypothetical protein
LALIEHFLLNPVCEREKKFGDNWGQRRCVYARHFARCHLRDGEFEHALSLLFTAALRTSAYKNEARGLGFESHPFRHDTSPAYIKGVRENFGHAQVVFEEFHVVSQVVAGCPGAGAIGAR